MVELDGRPLELEPLAYVLLHKPAGVVTTASDPHGRRTVVELVGSRSVVPVGRLDADTTGALLLTNDGPLAHRLMHPRYEVDKVYEAEVEGEPSAEGAQPSRRGRRARRRPDGAGRVRRLGPSRIELTLHEGRKHQACARRSATRRAASAAPGTQASPWTELSRAGGASSRGGSRRPAGGRPQVDTVLLRLGSAGRGAASEARARPQRTCPGKQHSCYLGGTKPTASWARVRVVAAIACAFWAPCARMAVSSLESPRSSP